MTEASGVSGVNDLFISSESGDEIRSTSASGGSIVVTFSYSGGPTPTLKFYNTTTSQFENVVCWMRWSTQAP